MRSINSIPATPRKCPGRNVLLRPVRRCHVKVVVSIATPIDLLRISYNLIRTLLFLLHLRCLSQTIFSSGDKTIQRTATHWFCKLSVNCHGILLQALLLTFSHQTQGKSPPLLHHPSVKPFQARRPSLHPHSMNSCSRSSPTLYLGDAM